MLNEFEMKIASLVSENMRDYEIARHLNISEDRFVRHLLNIFLKLNVYSRREVALRMQPASR